MSLLSRLAVSAARAYGVLSSNKNNVSASYLVVAGGGAGGGTTGGGGGAGGYQTSTFTLSTLNTYTIAVGAGGAYTVSSYGGNGVDSSISGTGLSTVTSTGGGGGGSSGISPPSKTAGQGRDGGSGGGGTNTPGANASGGNGTSGQGNNGGSGIAASPYCAGGGGGASAVGGNGSGTTAGSGGNGSASSISGSSVTYAGGGGGATNSGTTGTGGTGGGGAGANGPSNGTAGTANTGGGGGGAYGTYNPGAGGSGIVIISYTSATPKFTGGTVTTSGGNQIHTFTSSGTLSPLTPVTASYLVVAGGGGGGKSDGAGGGAGGLLASTTTLYYPATYTITVGGGGNGATSAARGSNGSDSILSGTGITTLTSTGGGGGGSTNGTNSIADGASGGSGGGGAPNGAYSGQGGTATSGQGNTGGNGSLTGTAYGAGGGGGSGAVGSNGSGSAGGAGGVGTSSSISGAATYYAGGGGGGTQSGSGGAGGNGGGGAGTFSTTGVAGTANTGGGGGGGGYNGTQQNGGAGGSGTVIISYTGSQVFNGGLVTSSGGNTIHTFNATGALTPLTNNLNNSLRFRASASAYLNRTPSTSGTGGAKTWTYSAWFKRGSLGSNQALFWANASSSSSDTNNMGFAFQSGDTLSVQGQTINFLVTTQVFRDPSAWYHAVLTCDTTQATAANRLKLYINGNQITAFSTANYPSQNATVGIGLNNPTFIGAQSPTPAQYFDGYLTDINFIDGQALEPYYFGNNDAYGNWKPIKYTGMYGTNGFYLTFADTSALTTSSNAGLGKDTSGNGNYWTTNNISITAGTTYDAMTDVPTNTSATVANYAVLNPLSSAGTAPINGNLTQSASVSSSSLSSIGIPSGKFYAEFTLTTAPSNWAYVGINSDTASFLYVYRSSNGDFYNNSSYVAYGASWTTNDVIGVAIDTVNNTLEFYKNNVSQGQKTGLSFSGSPLFTIAPTTSASAGAISANFGQRPFSYTPPTGFVALNTYNLPTPTILQGNKYMDATTYTATGTASQVIVNQGQFKPDLVWTKPRSIVGGNIINDSVRGASLYLLTNSTAAEGTDTTYLTSFNTNGYSIAGGSNWANGTTMVGWQWQAGQGSTSSNTSGSITSTVSVNATAGFSIVTYTSNNTGGATVGHGLGVKPSMIILKRRPSASDWDSYHTSLGATKGIALNTTAAATTSINYWNNTEPTSSVFTLGAGVNPASTTMLAYCWSEIAGFSKFGSYTGNGSADGPFVYTGFRPKYVMVKISSAATDGWVILDSSRNTYNVNDKGLAAESSGAEFTVSFSDFTSNGFKVRTTNSGYNTNSATYIYMAFAENPFKNSNAR